MEFGLGYFPAYDGMRPGEVARMAEERGYGAIYFAEHTHIPAAETERAPGRPLPAKYWRTYDLFVALTAVGAPCREGRRRDGVRHIVGFAAVLCAVIGVMLTFDVTREDKHDGEHGHRLDDLAERRRWYGSLIPVGPPLNEPTFPEPSPEPSFPFDPNATCGPYGVEPC
jgi:hypothetical protein